MDWAWTTPTLSSRFSKSRAPDCSGGSEPRPVSELACARPRHRPRKTGGIGAAGASAPERPARRHPGRQGRPRISGCGNRPRRRWPARARTAVPLGPPSQHGATDGGPPAERRPAARRRARRRREADAARIGPASRPGPRRPVLMVFRSGLARTAEKRRSKRPPGPCLRRGRGQAGRSMPWLLTVHRTMPARTRERKQAWRLRWRSRAELPRPF